MADATLALTLHRLPDGTHQVGAAFTPAGGGAVPQPLATNVPLALDLTALRAGAGDPAAHGQALTAQLFADPPMRQAWQRARDAGGAHLRVLLQLDPADPVLHSLRWETLRDPLDPGGLPLAQNERITLTRLLTTRDLASVARPTRPELRALLVISGPTDLDPDQFAEVDVAGEVARLQQALGEIPCTVLGDHPLAQGRRATRAHLAAAIGQGYPLVIIVAHGVARAGSTDLWLEQDDGQADLVAGSDLVGLLSAPTRRPLMVTLCACQSAGRGYGDGLAALGPQLARAGIPAVVAFQGPIAIRSAQAMLPALFTRLADDGRVDAAIAAARRATDDRGWWQAVLWATVSDGRLWEETIPDPRAEDRAHLQAIVRSHHDLIGAKLARFVGRAAELAALEAAITALQPSGGYLVVQGRAGQGKSSLLAALVARMLLVAAGQAAPDHWERQAFARLEQAVGPEQVPHHFIPYEPGPAYQVNLLRDLNARLCLRYGLPRFYADSTSLPALKDYLVAILRHVEEREERLTIVIDGLDQIAPELDGTRDLSFLPPRLPAGAVIVIGTRPDDTLLELERRTPCVPFPLPDLSPADFATILGQTGQRLAPALLDRFYAAMEQNALYLDLAAQALRAQPELDPDQLLVRVADNPDNLFSFTIERLSRGANAARWQAVTQPVLGLLLAAREPLSEGALRQLIGAPARELRQSLRQLGGLLAQTGAGRHFLFHLKLRDYLREDPRRPGKDFVFAADEEAGYHQRLADWCAGGRGGLTAIWQDVPGDGLEQERRAYARQHSVAHLAAARSYEQLWDVIDAGDYGRAKRRHDPSTRSYALDLDIARGAVVAATGGETDAQVRALPRLWRYSLLRGSLTSQADSYPEELFLALVALGRSSEAINLAELLSKPIQKVQRLAALGSAIVLQGDPAGCSTLQRARAIADTMPVADGRTFALRSLAIALARAHCWDAARATADAIRDNEHRAFALLGLAQALADTQRWDVARSTADAIPDASNRAEALRMLAVALAAARHPLADATFAAAHTAADAIPEVWRRAEAVRDLAQALADGQHPLADATFAVARTIADALPDAHHRAGVLSVLAASLARARHPLADATFAAARTTARAIPEAWRRDAAQRTLAEALATAGRWEEARATADAIPEAENRANALSTLVAALATAQRWDVARATADAIPDARRRAMALAALAAAYISAQHWDAARSTADAIPDSWHRAAALAALAQALAHVHHPLAGPTYAVARATVPVSPEDWRRSAALGTLVRALARAQHWDAARVAADVISAAPYQAEALQTLAEGLAAAQHPLADATFAAARAAADRIPEVWQRAATLRTLTVALAAAQHPLADATFAAARTAADTIADDWRRAFALRTLALGLADARRWDAARTTADAIPDASNRAEAMCGLAVALASAQHPLADATFAAARTVADAIPEAWCRAEALTALARALAHAQHPLAAATFAVARTTTDAIREESRRASALSTLAEALTQAQRWDDARAVADAIPEGVRQAQARNILAAALIAARHPLAEATFMTARHTTEAMPGDWSFARSQTALTAALAAAQRWADARSTADTILEDVHRAQALTTLAESLARAQRWNDACATAAAIPDAERRAAAFGVVVQAGSPPHATALLAELWQRAQTRDDLLQLFAITPALLRTAPEIGPAFLDGFAWVDAQLTVG